MHRYREQAEICAARTRCFTGATRTAARSSRRSMQCPDDKFGRPTFRGRQRTSRLSLSHHRNRGRPDRWTRSQGQSLLSSAERSLDRSGQGAARRGVGVCGRAGDILGSWMGLVRSGCRVGATPLPNPQRGCRSGAGPAAERRRNCRLARHQHTGPAVAESRSWRTRIRESRATDRLPAGKSELARSARVRQERVGPPTLGTESAEVPPARSAGEDGGCACGSSRLAPALELRGPNKIFSQCFKEFLTWRLERNDGNYAV